MPESDLSYAELWALEISAKDGGARIPVCFVLESANDRKHGFHQRFNMPLTGMDAWELGKVFWVLWKSGMISFENQRFSESDDQNPYPYFPVSAESLSERLLRENDLYLLLHQRMTVDAFASHFPEGQLAYHLTPQGFTTWEAYAFPQWEKLRGDFCGGREEPGESIWSQTATTREFAIRVLTNQASRWHQSVSVDWSTATCEWFQPWVVCPEKTLPEGVTVSVRVIEHESSGLQSNNDFPETNRQSRDYLEFCDICKWYRSVHEHPDCPTNL